MLGKQNKSEDGLKSPLKNNTCGCVVYLFGVICGAIVTLSQATALAAAQNFHLSFILLILANKLNSRNKVLFWSLKSSSWSLSLLRRYPLSLMSSSTSLAFFDVLTKIWYRPFSSSNE
ncbi:hypothetical protein E2C01_079699 [Portunus trituberculatus]|uniref:Uncharacterized protein n=1 Tax=Portunus trituberculatus TaxID=210409 RepID=A0A5B7IR71_PORTR|nr:hypothetical protein [Portunus trituberculatus]